MWYLWIKEWGANLRPFQPQVFKKHVKKTFAWQFLKLNIKICWFFDNSQVSLTNIWTIPEKKQSNKQTGKDEDMEFLWGWNVMACTISRGLLENKNCGTSMGRDQEKILQYFQGYGLILFFVRISKGCNFWAGCYYYFSGNFMGNIYKPGNSRRGI